MNTCTHFFPHRERNYCSLDFVICRYEDYRICQKYLDIKKMEAKLYREVESQLNQEDINGEGM